MTRKLLESRYGLRVKSQGQNTQIPVTWLVKKISRKYFEVGCSYFAFL